MSTIPRADLRARILFALCALVLSLLLMGGSLARPASAQIYVQIDGATSGPIRGDVTFPPEQDNIQLLRFSQTIQTPYDQDGRIVGPPSYGPFVVHKEQDPATVPLLGSMTTSERLTVMVRVYAPDQTGTTRLTYTVELGDVVLVDHSYQNVDGQAPTESWSMVFRTILWKDELNNISVSDTWGGSPSTAPAGTLEKGLALLPPLPNPTRGDTMLRFQLPESSEVDLSVFDLRGRRVATIFDGPTYGPNTSVRWDGRDLSGRPVSQGVYVIRLRSPEGETTQKLSLIR